jgi:putative ABC transport system substrate-binding protein
MRAAALALALWLAWPQQPAAQHAPLRVGWVHSGTEAMGRQYVAIMRTSLGRLGHVEGRTYVLDVRYVEGRFDRYPALIKEVVDGGAGVLVVAGYQGTAAAKAVTTKVPIIGIGCGVEVLVESLARPGGNITGLTCQSSELALKQMQVFREVLPRATHVALLHNATAHYMAPTLREVHAAGKQAGSTTEVSVAAVGEFAGAVERIRAARAEAVFIVPDLFVFANRNALMKALLDARMPAMASFAEFARAGALVTYGADLGALVERAGWYVDRISKGARPAELPMEQPTKFELVVNLATARSLGVTIPPAVLARADRVIESH